MAAPEPKPRPSPERLRALYIDEKKSLGDIGKEWSVSRALVAKWLRKDGVPVRSVSEGTSIAQTGRPVSEEHRQALARNAARARLNITAESRAKQAAKVRGKTPWNKGQPMREETRQILIEQRSDPEYRRKVSERNSGENAWNWQGGRKTEHERQIDSAEWRRIRQEVYKRDNWTCQECGVATLNMRDSKKDPKRRVQAHHIIPRRHGGTHDLDNLITYCMSCHHKVERRSMDKLFS